MRYPVPRPLPPAITGPTTGMVSGGGASTGGRGPAAEGGRVAGFGDGDGARRDDPFSRGAVTEASPGPGGGAVDAGAAGVIGCGSDTAVSGGVRRRDRSRQ